MEYTVYADLFFFENLIMNYIIISATTLFTRKLFSADASPLRKLSGAALGAVYGLLVILLPPASGKILGSLFGKAALSLIIVYAVYVPKKVLLMLKELLTFCLTGFIFAGTAIGVAFLGVPFTVTANGLMVTALPQSLTTAFLTIGLGYISVSVLINSLRKTCENTESYVSLYIEFDGQGLWLPALIDTGNELRDPLTGTPVIIVEASAVKSILCPQIAFGPTANPAENINFDNDTLDPTWAKRFRIIPFSSLGCENGLLPGFKADSIRVKGTFELPCENKSAIVCLYDKELSENKKYSALLSPELVA